MSSGDDDLLFGLVVLVECGLLGGCFICDEFFEGADAEFFFCDSVDPMFEVQLGVLCEEGHECDGVCGFDTFCGEGIL